MGTRTNFIKEAVTGAFDLLCYGVTPGSSITVCRDGDWRCETLPEDCQVEVDGICTTDLDTSRHDMPNYCPGEVDPKCGCPTGSTGTGGGEAGEGLSEAAATEVQAMIDACEDANEESLLAGKAP